MTIAEQTRAEGEAKAKAEAAREMLTRAVNAVLVVLETRKLPVSEELRARLHASEDLDGGRSRRPRDRHQPRETVEIAGVRIELGVAPPLGVGSCTARSGL